MLRVKGMQDDMPSNLSVVVVGYIHIHIRTGSNLIMGIWTISDGSVLLLTSCLGSSCDVQGHIVLGSIKSAAVAPIVPCQLVFD